MKNNLTLFWAAMLMFGLFSCSKSEEEITDNKKEAVLEQLLVQTAYEDVENLAIGLVLEANFNFRTQKIFLQNNDCSSAKITHDSSKQMITVDFGNGCTDGGVSRKGKFIVTYMGDFPKPGSQLTLKFENYFMNGFKLEGTKTTATRSIMPFPTLTIEFNSTVKDGRFTWENGKVTQFESTHVKKLIIDEKNDDLVVEVTGSSKGVNRFGISFTGVITNPLVFTESCLLTGVTLASKGTHLFVFGEGAVETDFGDGACDKKLKMTYNGKTVEVTVD